MDFSRDTFLNHLAQTTDSPALIAVTYAEGIYIYDTDNKRYTDLISGIGVTNIGHRHPKVVQAIKDQLDKHFHVMVYGEYIQSAQTSWQRKLQPATRSPQLQLLCQLRNGSK